MMKHLLALGCLAALTVCISATPAPTDTAPAASPTLNIPHSPTAQFNVTGPLYYLSTEVLSGNENLGGLYVTAYHTGAGENDAVLTDISVAAAGFLNGAFQEFDLGTGFQWGLYLAYTEFYTQWLPVQINAGQGGGIGQGDDDTNGTFELTGDGLVSSDPEWYGWIACDWNHGVPQLFWQISSSDIQVPCNCAQVKLCPVLIAT